MNGLWFRNKRYGWGWYPVSWQGWASLGVFLACFVIGEVVFLEHLPQSPLIATVAFLAYTAAILAMLVYVALIRGERPRWRWGVDIYKGVVIEGSRRARMLGFPTVNIAFNEHRSGVYVAEVSRGGKRYPAAAFADPARKLLEAYILDTDQDLYGETISIELLSKIRETEQYTSDDMLKSAIGRDVQAVREYFRL